MSIKIASFNVKNLNFGQGRDLDRIANIINDNNIDIVALQEVLGEGKILTGRSLNDVSGQAKAYEYSLKRRLRGNWRICWGNPETRAKDYPYLGEDSRHEGYAFMWKTDTIELPQNEHGKEIYPRIWHQYKHKGENRLRLIRDPFCGRFKVRRLNAEIRLITTHIVFGKPLSENLGTDIDYGAITLRRNEFETIAGEIYPRIAEYHKDSKANVPYTIILGDYNLNLISSGVNAATIPDIMFFDRNGHSYKDDREGVFSIKTVQNEKTTINHDENGYANNYDHFSFDKHTEGLIKDIGHDVYRIDAVHTHIKQGDISEEQKFSRYKREVSDHVPIVIELSLK